MPGMEDYGQSADHIEDFNSELAANQPLNEAVRQVESVSKIQNPDDVVAMCGECGSVQDTSRMEKDPFVQAGHAAVCRYCGGVVILVFREIKERAYDQISAQRGLFN